MFKRFFHFLFDFPIEEQTLEINEKISESDSVKLIYDFQFNAIKEAKSVLEKGFYFYMLMLSVLTGYILTKSNELNDKVITTLIIFVIILTFIVMICVVFLSMGIYLGLLDIQKTLKLSNKSTWKNSSIEDFIKRGAIVTKLIGIVGVLFMTILLALCFALLMNQDYLNTVELIK